MIGVLHTMKNCLVSCPTFRRPLDIHGSEKSVCNYLSLEHNPILQIMMNFFMVLFLLIKTTQ